MVYAVHDLIDAFAMHPAVGPVEVGVVEEDHQEDAEDKITRAIVADLPIGLGVFHQWRAKYAIADQGEDNGRDEGVADLSVVVAVGWQLSLDLFVEDLFPEDHIEEQEGDGGQENIAKEDHQEDGPELFIGCEIGRDHT